MYVRAGNQPPRREPGLESHRPLALLGTLPPRGYVTIRSREAPAKAESGAAGGTRSKWASRLFFVSSDGISRAREKERSGEKGLRVGACSSLGVKTEPPEVAEDALLVFGHEDLTRTAEWCDVRQSHTSQPVCRGLCSPATSNFQLCF